MFEEKVPGKVGAYLTLKNAIASRALRAPPMYACTPSFRAIGKSWKNCWGP